MSGQTYLFDLVKQWIDQEGEYNRIDFLLPLDMHLALVCPKKNGVSLS